jgi:hypothetical protein
LKVLKQERYDKRREAELIEQIVKWRLRPWCIEGRHEWIDAPIQIVLDCYLDTRNRVTPEINKYGGYYKQIADMTFDQQ